MGMAAKKAEKKIGSFPGVQQIRGDLSGAIVTGMTVLPSCIAAGVIAYGPLGPNLAAAGIAAAFSALIFGGVLAALFSSSSFIVNSPLTSISVVQASFVASLLVLPAFSENPALVIPALSACVALAGLMVMGIGLTGVASILKYTPHPVLAGFRNGIVASQLWQQIKPYIDLQFQQSGPLPFLANGQQFVTVLFLALAILVFDRFTKKIPAPFIGIALGAMVFYAAQLYFPLLDVGRAVGDINFSLPPYPPLLDAFDSATGSALLAVAPEIVQMAAVLAMLATLQSLPVYRLVKNQIATPLDPSRGLVALGIGNTISGLVGGLMIAAAGNQGNTAYRNGGRTRWVGIFLGLFYVAVATFSPSVLSLIPLIAISAIVIQNAAQSFDAWTTDLLKKVVTGRVEDDNRRAMADLLVAGVVMFATVGVSVFVGLGLGIALACLIFIIEMSRPLVRRTISGADMTSKRVRDGDAAKLLRETGEERRVFELNGVLFFGNTEVLCDAVLEASSRASTILLDLRGVTGMDASGEAILATMISRLKKAGKILLFCNVPTSMRVKTQALAKAGKMPAPFSDLDTALEWMEEQLLALGQTNQYVGGIQLSDHSVVRDLNEAELGILRSLLKPVSFEAGSRLCEQGDPGDRMWFLTEGAVSVRINTGDARGSRRVASLAKGTTAGEMALIEQSMRSAALIADEKVEALELSRDNYEVLLAEHPAIVNKLFGNLLRELAHRIRDNHLELRETVG